MQLINSTCGNHFRRVNEYIEPVGVNASNIESYSFNEDMYDSKSNLASAIIRNEMVA